MRSRVYCVRFEMLCSHLPPKSSLMHAHSSSGRQVLSSATAKAIANRRRGGGVGGGGAPPEQDGQSVDEYQGPHEGVCACVCVCVCVCVRACVRVCVRVCVMSNKVDTCPLTPHVCHVRLVPASMSCTVSVQKVTAGDQTWSVSHPSCPCSLCSPLCQHLPLQ